MKHLLLFTAVIALLSNQLFSQAPVPTSWDVTNITPPAGWSQGGGGATPPSTYGTGNFSAPSVKMNKTGHFVQIHLATEAGTFSYYLKGSTSNGAPFQGVFDIQISDDGISWNNVRTLTDNDISPSSYTMFTDNCTSTTRYIRYFFTNKMSGSNVSLDDMTVDLPLAGPEAEINVVENNDTIFSGGNLYTSENVGNTKRVNVIVFNEGTDSTLIVSNATSSNPAFVAVNSSLSILPLTSDTIKIDFTPTTSGTVNSLLTIDNNDANENPYLINLVGYGDGFATEPSTPSVTVSNIKTYSYDVNITPNAPLADEGYLVLFKNGTAPVGAPVDGQAYGAGDPIGNAKVAYVGTNLACFPREVYANSTYHLAVFAYSGVNQYTNYSDSVVTTVTTPVSMQAPTHYNGISTSATSFIDDLHTLTNVHSLRFYGNFDDNYIKTFGSRDTTNGQKVVTGRYSGYEHIYTPPFNHNIMSKEHSYPQSWMPTFLDAGFDNSEEQADYHNLFSVHQNSANVVRSNYALGEVINVTSTFMDGKVGTDVDGNIVYEPRDSHKGDAARALFYMCAAYTSVNGNSWAFPDPISTDPLSPRNYGQNQDVLKQWHWQDPVDGWEMARNDYIESLQGNRNPFIDSMNYVCFIDFLTMQRVVTAAPCTTTPAGLNEISNLTNYKVYPNPANTQLTLNYTLSKAENVSISVVDIYGKTIKEATLSKNKNLTKNVDLSNISNGVYFIKMNGDSFTKLIKFVKN